MTNHPADPFNPHPRDWGWDGDCQPVADWDSRPARSLTFADDLYRRLMALDPRLAAQTTIWSHPVQADDTLLLVGGPGRPFAIQLDPVIKVIIVSDDEQSGEYGTWHDDPTGVVLAFVAERYLAPADPPA